MQFSLAKSKLRFTAGMLAAGLCVAVPSCIPNLRPAVPAAPLPPDFNGTTSPENSALLGVQEYYEDPVLTGLIAQAMVANQELKILNEDIRIASNEVLARRGAYLPFLGLRADAGVERPSLYTPIGAAEDQLTFPGGGTFPDPLGQFRLSADVFWRVDIWRELRNARAAAGQRYLAAIEQRNDFVIRLVADVAENYYELIALDQRLQILDQVITLQEKSLATAEKLREGGRVSDLPVQRFRAEVRKNQSEKFIVAQEIIETENRINFLRGGFPQPVERPSGSFIDLSFHALSVGVPAQLLQFRPDIRQAERELAATGLDVQVARARFLPRLDITASVGFEAFSPRYLFNPDAFIGNLVGSLVTPVVNRTAIQADYGTANARQLQAVYDYQRTILNAFAEVVNNFSRAENYRRSVEIKKQQLTSLETSVDVATRLFQADRADYVDVLFSQRDLLDARTVIVQTKQQQLSALVNAYRALGGGLLLSNVEGYPNMFGCPPVMLQPDGAPFLPPPPAPPVPDAGGDDATPDDPAAAGRVNIDGPVVAPVAPFAPVAAPVVAPLPKAAPDAARFDAAAFDATGVQSQDNGPSATRTGEQVPGEYGQQWDFSPVPAGNTSIDESSDAAAFYAPMRTAP